jgi:hypothetical protein
MPVMLLPFFPLATVLVGIFSATYVRCDDFECTDIMHDTLNCDAVRCHDDGGFGCFCCTVCHDHDTPTCDCQLHDDSSEEFRSYY